MQRTRYESAASCQVSRCSYFREVFGIPPGPCSLRLFPALWDWCLSDIAISVSTLPRSPPLHTLSLYIFGMNIRSLGASCYGSLDPQNYGEETPCFIEIPRTRPSTALPETRRTRLYAMLTICTHENPAHTILSKILPLLRVRIVNCIFADENRCCCCCYTTVSPFTPTDDPPYGNGIFCSSHSMCTADLLLFQHRFDICYRRRLIVIPAPPPSMCSVSGFRWGVVF